MRSLGVLTDLTLTLGSEEWRVHRLLFAAASPYFGAVFDAVQNNGVLGEECKVSGDP